MVTDSSQSWHGYTRRFKQTWPQSIRHSPWGTVHGGGITFEVLDLKIWRLGLNSLDWWSFQKAKLPKCLIKRNLRYDVSKVTTARCPGEALKLVGTVQLVQRASAQASPQTITAILFLSNVGFAPETRSLCHKKTNFKKTSGLQA